MRPIQPKVVEDVAREFQLDEVEAIPSGNHAKIDADVYNSENFIQNLGEALSRFRLSPTSRDRK
jgi:hypothetical protein